MAIPVYLLYWACDWCNDSSPYLQVKLLQNLCQNEIWFFFLDFSLRNQKNVGFGNEMKIRRIFRQYFVAQIFLCFIISCL